MIQAALWLARSGLPQYFEDAERRIRSHIVPSQCTHDTEDQGWGVPAPSDREGGSGTKSVVDITAGVVQALCATTETLVTKDDKGQSVNLAFSNWKGPVRVRSGLPEEWRLEITPDEQGNVRVRIPSWADRSKLRVNVEGQQRRAAVENAWLVLEDIPGRGHSRRRGAAGGARNDGGHQKPPLRERPHLPDGLAGRPGSGHVAQRHRCADVPFCGAVPRWYRGAMTG